MPINLLGVLEIRPIQKHTIAIIRACIYMYKYSQNMLQLRSSDTITHHIKGNYITSAITTQPNNISLSIVSNKFTKLVL